MKLFGSKDDNAPDDLDNDALNVEDFDGLDDPVRPAGDFSASGPRFGDTGRAAGGKSRLLVLLALLAGGAVGGYMYLTSGADDVQPRTAARTPATAVPATPDNAALPLAADTTLATGATPPLATGETPPVAGGTLPAEGLTAPPLEAHGMDDAALLAQEDLTGPLLPAPEIPVSTIDPVALDAAADAAPTAADMALNAAEIDMPDQNELAVPYSVDGVPSAASATTALASGTPASAPVDDAVVDEAELKALEMAKPGATLDPAPLSTGVAENGGAPAGDLPLPDGVPVAAVTDPSDAAVPPLPQQTSPSPAELAIVENAAMLDQLSAPATGTVSDPAAQGRTVNEILGRDAAAGTPAIVRPMPPQYVVVRKDYGDSDIETRLRAARAALAQNRHAAALQLFDEIGRDYPRDRRIMMGRALALQNLGQTDAALLAYEDVLGEDPSNIEALTNMLGLLKTQNPALAVEKLTELRDAYPFNPDIMAQLGVAHASMRSYDEALRYLDMADALRPNSTFVMYNKAVLFDRMGRTEAAATLYRTLLKHASDGRADMVIPAESIRNRLSSMR